MQVRAGNIRTQAELGGGPLFDLGVYCINAARYLFRDEPIEVTAFASAGGRDPRFAEVEEAVSAILRFPDSRLATFSCSFGAADVSHFQIIGTRGDLRADPAFEYDDTLRLRLTIDGETRERSYPRRDQFGPELLYFSDCIVNDRAPEPGASEGLIDVMIIESIFESMESGRVVAVPPLPPDERPEPNQRIRQRPVKKRRLVEVQSAHVE
jgi:glucose-fructose oxidoreductase